MENFEGGALDGYYPTKNLLGTVLPICSSFWLPYFRYPQPTFFQGFPPHNASNIYPYSLLGTVSSGTRIIPQPFHAVRPPEGHSSGGPDCTSLTPKTVA